MEMKSCSRRRPRAAVLEELYKMAKTTLSLPDTSMKDYIAAEQAAERLRDGYAEYFRCHDALITHVLPIPAHSMAPPNLSSTERRSTPRICGRDGTAQRSIPACPVCRCGLALSKEAFALSMCSLSEASLPNFQTILHLASLLEGISPVRDLRPNL